MSGTTYFNMELKMRTVRVCMSPDQIRDGRETGAWRNTMQRKWRTADGATILEDSLADDILGALGEKAASVGLGIPWEGQRCETLENWRYWQAHGSDLAFGIEVKAIKDPTDGLLIRIHDRYKADKPYILVLVKDGGSLCEILGWLPGDWVKTPSNFRDIPTVKRACYIAKQGSLWPLDRLMQMKGLKMPPDVEDSYFGESYAARY